MRFLARATFVSLGLLALQALSFTPIAVVVPLAAIGAGFMVFAFVSLGARAFDFFDPTVVAGYLFEQLQRTCNQVLAGSHRYHDPSFQLHLHRRAQVAKDTLVVLADIAETEKHLNDQPYANLASQLLVFLEWYEHKKARIPTNSRWYLQRFKHPTWYETSDTEVNIAHQSSGLLTPQQVANFRWLEDGTLSIVSDCLRMNLSLKRFDTAIGVLKFLDLYVKSLASLGEVQFAISVVNSISAQCKETLFATYEDGVEREPLEQLGIVELFATMPISVFLGYLSFLDKIDSEKISSSISRIDWRTQESLYSVGLPRCCLDMLEWFKPRIDFERDSEGVTISPNWYVSEIVRRSIADVTEKNVTALYNDVRRLYEQWLETAKKLELPWVMAVIVDLSPNFHPV